MDDVIRIMNWNVAGAKFLQTADKDKRERFKERINDDLANCIKNLRERAPHIVTLQEIVQYKIPDQNIVELIDEKKFPDYTYLLFPMVDTQRHTFISKWKKIEKLWPEQTYFSQGNAVLFRKDLTILPIWSLSRSSKPKSSDKNIDDHQHTQHHLVEKVSIESGLYFGDRNTEPRCALVSHFVFDRNDRPEFIDKENKPIPQDVFVINLHLTTLTNEREGIPDIDEEAAKIRLKQLDLVFKGIVSRYNRWAKSGFLTRGEKPTLKENETTNRFNPLWILCGDFNFTLQSEEYEYINRRNFVDVIPNKGLGTKSSGYDKDASLTLDYIFAGPKFISLDDHFGNKFAGNFVDQNIRCSDHRPMYAQIPLAYR